MKKTLRNYKNSVILQFDHCGKNHTLKVPHHGKWIQIMNFLKKRGFDIRENPTYKEHYASLSKYHKIGFKKDVALLMEINASSITVEFGNIKNLWKEMAQSFWSNPTDERYTKLTYLEGVAVKLEIKKLMDFCGKFNLDFIKEDDNLSPEEFIIHKLKINPHIHGKVECLNDIKLSITPDTYDWKCNSNDQNKKKIICGETKYFYDYYNNRLSYGVVWHNINNMWWVISGGKLRNIASFNLFDFEIGLPRRKPADDNHIDRLLKKFEGKKDYQRCANIQKHHQRKLQLSA